MSRTAVLERMITSGVIAVVRASKPDQLVDAARALVAGGVESVEITMTTPGALGVIEAVSKALKDDVVIGAGTVLDAETARLAILAGARFVVGPALDFDMITMAHRYDVAAVPGAFTPTEVVRAWQAGADMVKIFPASIGGPDYFKALRGPLPQVRLLPTGGVNLETAGAFIQAGAALIAVGGELVKKNFLDDGDMAGLTALARRYVDIVRTARG